MLYRSKLELLGLPLIHVTTVPEEGSTIPRGVARGWIAIGDIAFGVLFSLGGVAVGGVALGGVAVGVVTLAGLAIGAYAIGGLALGWIALGGAAIGAHAALGGAAIAKDFAVGGVAIAEHANDDVARAFMEESSVRYGKVILDHAYLFVLLPLLNVFLIRKKRTTPQA